MVSAMDVPSTACRYPSDPAISLSQTQSTGPLLTHYLCTHLPSLASCIVMSVDGSSLALHRRDAPANPPHTCCSTNNPRTRNSPQRVQQQYTVKDYAGLQPSQTNWLVVSPLLRHGGPTPGLSRSNSLPRAEAVPSHCHESIRERQPISVKGKLHLSTALVPDEQTGYR